jgi:hypothetical protein
VHSAVAQAGAAVEAGHDGRRVQHVRHAALAQRVQVPRSSQRACAGRERNSKDSVPRARIPLQLAPRSRCRPLGLAALSVCGRRVREQRPRAAMHGIGAEL